MGLRVRRERELATLALTAHQFVDPGLRDPVGTGHFADRATLQQNRIDHHLA